MWEEFGETESVSGYNRISAEWLAQETESALSELQKQLELLRVNLSLRPLTLNTLRRTFICTTSHSGPNLIVSRAGFKCPPSLASD